MNIGLVILICLVFAGLVVSLAVWLTGASRMPHATSGGRRAAPPLYPPLKGGQMVECDLTGARRPCFRVRISHKWPVLHVYTPSKATADRLLALGPVLARLSQECLYSEQTETDEAEVFSLAVAILSHNRENFSERQIERLIDREQAVVFLCDYLGWLTDLLERKN